MLLTFEIFGTARNHGKSSQNNVRPPFAVSSITIHFQNLLSKVIPSPRVQGQKGYPVLEFGLETLEAVGWHIPVYPMILSAPPPVSNIVWTPVLLHQNAHAKSRLISTVIWEFAGNRLHNYYHKRQKVFYTLESVKVELEEAWISIALVSLWRWHVTEVCQVPPKYQIIFIHNIA